MTSRTLAMNFHIMTVSVIFGKVSFAAFTAWVPFEVVVSVEVDVEVLSCEEFSRAHCACVGSCSRMTHHVPQKNSASIKCITTLFADVFSFFMRLHVHLQIIFIFQNSATNSTCVIFRALCFQVLVTLMSLFKHHFTVRTCAILNIRMH